MDASAVLVSAEDQVIDEAVAALAQRDQARHQPPSQLDERREVRQLFRLVVRCVQAGRTEPIIRPSEQIAAHCYAAGIDHNEVQETFNVLAEALWRHLAWRPGRRAEGSGARAAECHRPDGRLRWPGCHLALAIRDRNAQAEQSVGESATQGAGSEGRAGDVVRTGVACEVGIITLEDRDTHNAIGVQMADGVIAALQTLRARQVRAIVLRAAAGMGVWSAGHDIDELPRGRRDPLGYNDPLEELIRAVRTFPAPVVAMVHGTVWGGALDLVLSCDLAIADETASFAITPANLGLPYNITGLLHFQGRLPINVIKEMFFTAAPIDARKAKEWLLINHLVPWDRLESFTMELAATMATKSPLAIAVIKEQLRVLSDYQPIAAQVYERVQGLRQEAYDSGDYLEGLNAFTQKRQPIFRGT